MLPIFLLLLLFCAIYDIIKVKESARGEKNMSEKIFYRASGSDEYYKIWHTSSDNMIIFMHSSGGSLVCSEKALPINKGALCFVGSGVYHCTVPEEPSRYIRSKIFATNEEQRGLLALLREGDGIKKLFSSDALVYAQISENDLLAVERLFEDAQKCSEREGSDFVRMGAYMRLLAYIEENKLESVSPRSDFIDRAISYVNAHLTEPVCVEDICDAVHVSKYHFCREFKKRTGKTVMEYVLSTRIVLSKEMLARSDLGIGEISERCGFSSISYFCRAFRQDTGKTPLQYKKAAQKR